MRPILLFTFIAAFLFTACKKDDSETAKIIVRDQNSVVMKNEQTIKVNLNSVHQTLVRCEFSGVSPQYIRQFDQGEIDYVKQGNDYEAISSGWTGYLDFEESIITTSFSDSVVHAGSVVSITVRLGTELSKTVYYEVQ